MATTIYPFEWYQTGQTYKAPLFGVQPILKTSASDVVASGLSSMQTFSWGTAYFRPMPGTTIEQIWGVIPNHVTPTPTPQPTTIKNTGPGTPLAPQRIGGWI